MRVFALFACLQECLYLLLLWVAPQVKQDVGFLPSFLGLWSALFGVYFFSLYWLQKQQKDGSIRRGSRWWVFLLGSGLVFRVTALFLPLVLSHDVYGYMWHGRVQAHGYNPYLYTATDPVLAHLRDSLVWPNLSFKEIVAVYPAFIMHVFRLGAHLGGDSVLLFKAMQLIPELVIFFAGTALLKVYGRSPLWILIYAWCPLPIVEYVGMGHSDAWGVAAVTLFLYFYKTSRVAASAAALACGVLVKWLPVLFVPWVLLDLRGGRRWKWLGVFAASLAACYLPFFSARDEILGFLPAFMNSYAFNGSVYKIFHEWIGRGDWAHQAANACIGGSALLIAWRQRDLQRACFALLLAFFIFTYQVFPWYLGYFLPFLLLRSSWAAWSWLFTSIFSYQVLMPYLWTGTWIESPYVLLIQYIPFYALLLAQWIRENRWETWKRSGEPFDVAVSVPEAPLHAESGS